MNGHLRHTAHPATVDDEQGLLVLPDVPDDAPEVLREGIARRRITATTGRCRCGAVLVMPNRAQRRQAARRGGTFTTVRVEHEDGCPATNDVLEPALRAWKATR
ncbi:hypothetical protein [Kineococcus rubinsiae]|uniref:hypothetical protein n=1 Tax=Kineococcus rubinsiae TaxID=2609562 RepID=UPI001430CE2C|nr:hypothetical protein [Kineococcus rubinsiae]NIZ91573.1 hypothetical protein [Kineococcus rubinsiae]